MTSAALRVGSERLQSAALPHYRDTMNDERGFTGASVDQRGRRRGGQAHSGDATTLLL